MASKASGKAKGGYIFCKKVVRKDDTVIRPKKAEALRIPISTLKNRKFILSLISFKDCVRIQLNQSRPLKRPVCPGTRRFDLARYFTCANFAVKFTCAHITPLLAAQAFYNL